MRLLLDTHIFLRQRHRIESLALDNAVRAYAAHIQVIP